MHVLITYTAVSVLTAFCYSIFWLFCKHKVDKPILIGEMLLRVLVYSLFWPIPFCLVLRDRDRLHFLSKYESNKQPKLDDAYFAERERQWQEQIANLPVCGSHIYYQASDSYNEGLPAIFIFESEDLTPFVFDAIGPDNTQAYCQERILYHWLVKRDHALQVCSPIDSCFNRLEYIVAKMIKTGHGEAFCKHCYQVFKAKDIKHSNDYSHTSWQFENLHCPNKHLLLRNRTIHFFR